MKIQVTFDVQRMEKEEFYNWLLSMCVRESDSVHGPDVDVDLAVLLPEPFEVLAAPYCVQK